MDKTKTPMIELDGKRYNLEEISDAARNAAEHIDNLERKIRNTIFTLEEFKVNQNAYFSILRSELKDADPVVEAAE